MIYYCPFCGHVLKDSLKDGFTTCSHCNRIFDSCRENRLLSAAWAVRRRHFISIEQLQYFSNLPADELEIIDRYIIEEGYCHDDFLKLLKTVDLSPAA